MPRMPTIRIRKHIKKAQQHWRSMQVISMHIQLWQKLPLPEMRMRLKKRLPESHPV